VAGAEQHESGDEDDGAENIGDEVEAGEQVESSDEEKSAHEDGAEYAPGEDAVLLCRRHGEGAEEDEEEEEVVDAEGLFQEIGAGELDGQDVAEAEVEQHGENCGEGEPGEGPAQGFAERGAGVVAEAGEVGDEHRPGYQMEANPPGKRDVGGHR
jgi:hypothetical protein